jgi:hypothetical protein
VYSSPIRKVGMGFFTVDELDAGDAQSVQGRVRHRILRAFVRRGLIDKDERKQMQRREWSRKERFKNNRNR